MSKSIYEEAYEDVRRLMQDEFDDPSRHENPKLNKQERINICIGIKQALKKAQKQEKLLGLYEELVGVKEDLLSCCEVTDLDYYDIKDVEFELEQKIGDES